MVADFGENFIVVGVRGKEKIRASGPAVTDSGASHDENGAQRRFHLIKKHHNTNYFGPVKHFPALFFEIRKVHAKKT